MDIPVSIPILPVPYVIVCWAQEAFGAAGGGAATFGASRPPAMSDLSDVFSGSVH